MNHSREAPRRWLTVAEICAQLRIAREEWDDWQAQHKTPLGVIGLDGDVWVSVQHYERWLDSLTDHGGPEMSA